MKVFEVSNPPLPHIGMIIHDPKFAKMSLYQIKDFCNLNQDYERYGYFVAYFVRAIATLYLYK